jgi:hypothetical protein
MSLAARTRVHQIRHQRFTSSRGLAGGQVRAPQIIPPNPKACRIVPVSDRPDDPMERYSVEYDHSAYFAYDPQAIEQDQFIGVGANMAGRIFRVVGVRNFDFRNRLYRVDLMEVLARQSGPTG